MSTIRPSKRSLDQLREIKFTRNYTSYAEGSVLVEFGQTKVLCNATVENKVPVFLKGKNQGWLTAEYAMLPRSTHTRNIRDITKGQPNSRGQEISRLIGRSLRSVIDLGKLGERQIIIDCDVIQADGGTRTAAITGSYVALCDAVKYLLDHQLIVDNPIHQQIAAISVGVYQGIPILDLDYAEDSAAETDMNVVMNNKGEIIEIQGTAEAKPFNRHTLDQLIDLAAGGINQLIGLQRVAIG